MSTPDFLVVFSGATLDGFEQQSVQTQVEAALRLTKDQSGKLFSGKPVVIKRTQDRLRADTGIVKALVPICPTRKLSSLRVWQAFS